MTLPTPVTSMVSALSVMLGAYAFFYNAYSPRLRAGIDIGPPAANRTAWRKQVHAVRGARATGLALGAIPFVVFAIFAPEVWSRIEAAVTHPFHHYSALDVTFVLLACGWLAIGFLVSHQAMGLSKVLTDLEKAEPPT
jgi:succinate dehydrogenase hydrophobic anchor subunit